MPAKVIFIDDEESMLDLIKEILEDGGDIEVVTEANSVKAVERLEKESFDVIICDYQMPRKNGIEVLRELRGHGNTTPFIMFTARGKEEVESDPLQAGANAYIQKKAGSRAVFVELREAVANLACARDSGLRNRDPMTVLRSTIESLPIGVIAIRPGRRTGHAQPSPARALGPGGGPDEGRSDDLSSTHAHQGDQARGAVLLLHGGAHRPHEAGHGLHHHEGRADHRRLLEPIDTGGQAHRSGDGLPAHPPEDLATHLGGTGRAGVHIGPQRHGGHSLAGGPAMVGGLRLGQRGALWVQGGGADLRQNVIHGPGPPGRPGAGPMRTEAVPLL